MKKNTKMLLIYVGMIFVWPIVISLILELILYWKMDLFTENQGLLIVNLSVYLLLLVSILRLYGENVKWAWEKEKKYVVKYFVLYGVGLWFVNLLIDNIVALWGMNISDNQEIVNTLSATNYFVSLIIVVFIGPLVEEVVFRYIIMNHFEKKRKYLGILISSALFGILHMSALNAGEFFMYFISGLYLGILYFKTNSLIAIISAHIFSNLVNMILTLIIISMS